MSCSGTCQQHSMVTRMEACTHLWQLSAVTLSGNAFSKVPDFGTNNTHLYLILMQQAFIQDRENWIKCACLLKAGKLCLHKQRKRKLAVYSTIACTHTLKFAALSDALHPTNSSCRA